MYYIHILSLPYTHSLILTHTHTHTCSSRYAHSLVCTRQRVALRYVALQSHYKVMHEFFERIFFWQHTNASLTLFATGRGNTQPMKQNLGDGDRLRKAPMRWEDTRGFQERQKREQQELEAAINGSQSYKSNKTQRKGKVSW